MEDDLAAYNCYATTRWRANIIFRKSRVVTSGLAGYVQTSILVKTIIISDSLTIVSLNRTTNLD
jgi:hypothetical protein